MPEPPSTNSNGASGVAAGSWRLPCCFHRGSRFDLGGLFSFLGVNTAYGVFQGLEEKYISDTAALDLALPDLSQVSRIYSGDGSSPSSTTAASASQGSAMSPRWCVDAVLAAEDSASSSTRGSTQGHPAAEHCSRTSAATPVLQGGSTITQQVVKMNFLSTEVTLERKICEMVIAAELERRYTKDQILEFYMNSVFYGCQRLWDKGRRAGVFRQGALQLSLAEAATIVVPIRNPSLYDLRRRAGQRRRAVERRHRERMVEHGFITESRSARPTAPLELTDHQPFVGPEPRDPDRRVRAAAQRQPVQPRGDLRRGAKQALYGCPANEPSAPAAAGSGSRSPSTGTGTTRRPDPPHLVPGPTRRPPAPSPCWTTALGRSR